MTLTADDLRRYLPGKADPLGTLAWLNDTFLPEVVTRFNSTDVRRRLGLYAGDRIPENETNLTDVRNRVSLIAEYELARIATRVLEDHGITDLFWSYVVANRFPDLEVRDDRGARGLRIEVKCLQTIAEEKAANFDTLRKDLNPKTDYVVAFLWEWGYDREAVIWDRAPLLIRAYTFHASSLACIRDWFWLHRPPRNLGDGVQGFDLRYAVTCSEGRYKEEEGNYGKLLRIWEEDFDPDVPRTPLVDRTVADYLRFKDDAITAGAEALAKRLLPGFSGGASVAALTHDGRTVGWQAGDVCFILRSKLGDDKADIVAALTATRVIEFSDKYDWVEYSLKGGRLEREAQGKKPKHLSPGPHGS